MEKSLLAMKIEKFEEISFKAKSNEGYGEAWVPFG